MAGARGKYQQWLKPDKLEQVTNWIANGMQFKDVASNMGVHVSTFCDWVNKYPEFSEAVKKGQELSLPTMENVFFSKARGGIVVTEEIEEFRGEFKDGKPWNGTGMRRTVRKKLPPDTTALIFYLKNKGKYANDPEATAAPEEPTRIIIGLDPKRIDD